jgi:hypothetical protein
VPAQAGGRYPLLSSDEDADPDRPFRRQQLPAHRRMVVPNGRVQGGDLRVARFQSVSQRVDVRAVF